MTKLCKVYASRKRALLLLFALVVTLMVTMVTNQTWRSFAVSTLGLARHGTQNESKFYGTEHPHEVVRNLTFVLPHSGHLLGTPYPFSKSAVLQERFYGNHRRHHGNRTAYNILCHHIRFHYDNIRDLMPNDTVYVTIVRNPVDMFESAFQYYGFGTKYNISQPDALKTFLDNPSSYVKKFGERRHSHNALFYDLGYDNGNLTSEQTIKSTIRHLDRIFSVVMVADHFEESLILLRHALCWDLDDVTFFKINSRNEKSEDVPVEGAETGYFPPVVQGEDAGILWVDPNLKLTKSFALKSI
ncbi:galactosylceramide sulfotransferase-like [Branchiostoma floridae]|uniref:Galactosylceramide sulfotransferase-like n=1 Tax=Branchiostoma floridae TaxID=7739 RepID=A0A9J7HSJ3_BRAFL|nr:galactosylceramide sulfotransferase-like [Branchiostoma floridae]